MSKLKFEATLNESFNADPEDTHSMRDLTMAAFRMQAVSNAVRKASDTMAEHYHRIALGVERKLRKEHGTTLVSAAPNSQLTDQYKSANEDDLFVIRKALAVFRSMVGEEVRFLQTEHSWDKDKLPSAGDGAVRKIFGAWKNGFSLEFLDTCSKCGKANSAKEKEDDQALLPPKEKPASDGGVELTGNPEVDEALKNIIAKAKEGVEKDSKVVTESITAYDRKLTGMVSRMAVGIAKAVNG